VEQVNRTIFLAGPYYTAEDRYQADAIDAALLRGGYASFLPRRDGIDSLYGGKAIGDDRRAFRMAKAIFALNVYVLAERCAGLVFNMNGRVPDEGGTILASLAFMLGKPVILFKNDARSKLHGHDNSMITGLAGHSGTIRDIDRIPALLGRLLNKGAGTAGPGEPAHPLRAAIEAGRGIWQAVDRKAHGRAGSSRDLSGEAIAICEKAGFGTGDAGLYDRPRKERPTVYCSGPLFCAGEIVIMGRMASALERAGYSAFLPHRDGLEAFVLNQVDSPLANSLLAAPVTRLMHRGGFAIDAYAIVRESDFFVVNVGGRAPDDGAMSEIGLAFAAGRPIVIYDGDGPAAHRGRLDPMVLGAACDTEAISDIGLLPGALDRLAARMRPAAGPGGHVCPAPVERELRFGRRFLGVIRKLGFLRPGRLFGVHAGR
jgi:nucleoside 2-deoxyribosyltransferase